MLTPEQKIQLDKLRNIGRPLNPIEERIYATLVLVELLQAQVRVNELLQGEPCPEDTSQESVDSDYRKKQDEQ